MRCSALRSSAAVLSLLRKLGHVSTLVYSISSLSKFPSSLPTVMAKTVHTWLLMWFGQIRMVNAQYFKLMDNVLIQLFCRHLCMPTKMLLCSGLQNMCIKPCHLSIKLCILISCQACLYMCMCHVTCTVILYL